MDCNRFSGPMCSLKFHDVCARIRRLSPTFANSSQHNPSISTARLCPLRKGEHAYPWELSSPPSFFSILPRFDWLRASRGLSGYCSFCKGPFWRMKGMLSRSATPISFLPQNFLVSAAHSIRSCIEKRNLLACLTDLLMRKSIIVLYSKNGELSL